MLSVTVMSSEGLAYIAATAVLSVVYFSAHSFKPSCFDDCYGYTGLMGMSVFSPDYSIWVRKMFRGFAVPVIYSAFGAQNEQSEAAIVYFQSVTALAAWLFFALAISSFVTGRWRRFMVFVVIASGMFSRGYLRFDDRLLSDSLALSLVLGWFALIVKPVPVLAYLASRCGKVALPVFLAITCVMTAFVISARDTNAFLVVFCIPLAFVQLRRVSGPRFGAGPTRVAALTSAMMAAIVVLQLSSAAKRNTANMANIIVGMVIGDSSRTEFFVSHGMPLSLATLERPQSLRDAAGLRAITDNRALVLGALASTRNVARARAGTFIRSQARLVYATYLVTHPGYVMQNLRESWYVMFDQWYGARPQPGGVRSAFEVSKRLSAFDLIDIRTFVLLSVLCLTVLCVLNPAAWRNPLLQIGATLALAGVSNAIIGFHGDLWELSEMARHGWLGSTFLRLGAGIMLLSLPLYLYEQYETRRHSTISVGRV